MIDERLAINLMLRDQSYLIFYFGVLGSLRMSKIDPGDVPDVKPKESDGYDSIRNSIITRYKMAIFRNATGTKY